MVEDMTPQDGGQPAPDSASMPDGTATPTGFLSTQTGKLVLIGGAVLAFLVVAGLVAFAVFTFVLQPATTPETTTPTPAAAGSTESTEAAQVIVEPGQVPLSDLFTFRDIFRPLIATPDASALETTSVSPTSPDATTSTDDDQTTAANTESNTLYLQDIISEDGVAKAVLVYEDQEYTLAEGESIPGTPWEVLSIGTTSVTMLYGDVQVTISIGQGVTK